MPHESKISLEDGKNLIDFARENIVYFLKNSKKIVVPKEIKQNYGDKFGAFVTLNTFGVGGNPLRGCIGYIEPTYSLYEAIHKLSISSATEDPRFPSVTLEEMNNIVIELSILTPPELIRVESSEEYLNKIVIGRDGLIVESGMRRGLLLPQVPVSLNRKWSIKEFLGHTCQKAWLSEDAWKDVKKTKIFSFEAILFEEVEPNGEVVRKSLT